MTQTVGFDFVDRRVMAAVQRVASNDPNPADPFRGLYISDETAPAAHARGVRVGRRRPARRRHRRARAGPARRRGARHLRRAGAQPALRAAVRLPAGRRHPQAPERAARRAPARGRGRDRRRRDDVASTSTGRCAGSARSSCSATRRRRSPSGPLKVADRLAAHLLGARLDDLPAPSRLRLVDLPAHDPGRHEHVAAVAAMLARPSELPVVLCGPDAEALLAKAYGRPLVVAHVRDMEQRDVMADAALISALEGRPIVFEGLEDLDPAERAPAAARARASAASASWSPRPRAARRSRSATARSCSSRRRRRPTPSASRRGPTSRASRTRATWPPSSGSRWARSSRRPRSRGWPPARAARSARRRPTWTSARARRPPRGSASSPRGSRRATAGCDLVVPERQLELLQSISAYLRHRDRVLVRLGLRPLGRAHAGAEGAVRRRVRHGQDDGRAGARRRARPGDLPRRPRDDREQVHRRDREEPRPHLRRRRRLQRDPLLRRGRRAVRQALGDLGLARPLREHRGRLPAAEDGGLRGRGHPRHELPAQHRRRVRAPPGLRDRLPVPGGRGPQADLAAAAARGGAARRRPRHRLPRDAVQALGRLDPQLLAVGRLPGRRRRAA